MTHNINSDTIVSHEQHFRVSAGPGAGKTHWLINHIKNVLNKSLRLHKTRKIACITYTNIAVETILNRLGTSANQVEVSTIHSFLYNNIIKPYLVNLAEEYEVNAKYIDGHDDPFVNFKYVASWIETHSEKSKLTHPYTENQLTKRPENKEALINWLSSLHYKFDESNNLVLSSKRDKAFYLDSSKTRKYLGKRCVDVLEKDLWSYKKLYWQRGILFHDDILFFSLQLLQTYPFILKVLRAKYPYFFIDEYQDTNPLQDNIVKQIGGEETIVGIIGDKAQSIYGFQDANPSQFISFKLPDLIDYKIGDNRRSTNQIVSLLNTIRSDMNQSGIKNEDGQTPTLIVGDTIDGFRKAQELIGCEEIVSLSRNNITSNAMKIEMEQNIPSQDLLQSLYEVDSNRDRRNLIIACIKAIELARQKRFKEAIKELYMLLKREYDKTQATKEALKQLIVLLQNYDNIIDKSLYEFREFVNDKIKSISGLRGGKIKDFYDNNNYQQLAVCVKIVEDTSLHRTIHKAKGTEFDNVLLVLSDEKDIEFITSPDLDNNEEHRINYVAVSRAKKQLFISVPTLDSSKEEILKSNFTIIKV